MAGKELSHIPDSRRSDYFEVRVGSLPAPVRIEYSAIRELREVFDAKADGIGLLLGSSSAQAVSIQRCELLALSPATLADPKLLQGAFRQFIRARLQTPLEDAPALLGCFRTQNAGWPRLKDSDLEIAKTSFPGLEALFLLIQTSPDHPWLASLFTLDSKTETASAQLAHEFPFDEYLLRNGYVSAIVERPQPPEMLPEMVPTDQNKVRLTVGAVLLGLLLAGSAAYKWFGQADRPGVAGRSAVASGILKLKVNRSGKDFEISWDLLSQAVQQATDGKLTIQDGTMSRAVTLTGPQLREGRILYTPLFDELTFRLEVATPNQEAVAESVQVLAWSGKREADVLVVAPGQPASNSPARIVASDGARPLPSTLSSILSESARNEKRPPAAVTTVAKAAPAANKPSEPASAKPSPIQETASVVPPAPSNSGAGRQAAPASARVPDLPAQTPPPAVAPERAPPIQTSPQMPPTVPPEQTPRAPAPQAEAPPVRQNSAPPAPAPATPLPASTASVSAAAVPPVPIQRVSPVLPRNIAAAVAGVSRATIVSVRMMVDSSGSVQSAQVIGSSPKGMFGETAIFKAVLDAAKTWKFRPGQLNGQNAAAEYTIDFKF